MQLLTDVLDLLHAAFLSIKLLWAWPQVPLDDQWDIEDSWDLVDSRHMRY